MAFALIFPEQRTEENYMRVVQVAPKPFDVAQPLFWKESDQNLYSGEWAYDDLNDVLIQIVVPGPIVDESQVLNSTSGTKPNVII